MGPDASIPKLDPATRAVNETNRGVTQIPYKLPQNCKLSVVRLNGNRIRELPPKLNRLTVLSLAKNGLTEIPKEMAEAISSYLQLESLDLSYNDLSSLPPSFANLKNLKTFNAFGNKLSNYPLSSIPIETIDIGDNIYTEIPKIHEKIANLSMDCNKIRIVNAKLQNLMKLTLSFNFIEQITPESHFRMLESLDLSNNLLRSCPDFLKQTPRLRRIDLSHNFIEKMPQLPRSLSVLLMADNRLKTLPDDFSQLPYIVHIDFSQNMIKKVPPLPMSIQIVDLSQNKITEIMPSETPDLVDLRIHHNLLTSMPKFTSNQVVELSISNNKMTSIDVTLLNPEITCIDFSDNCITEVPEELFDLEALFLLNLARNNLKTLPAKVASSSVVFLTLSGNPIEELPELPQTVEVLNIANCGLREIPASVAALTELVELSCPNNKLKTLPAMPSLQRVNLSKNRFKSIPDLPPTVLKLDISMNQLKELPTVFPPQLEYIDLAFNKITKFPDSFSSNSFVSMNLNGNPIDDSLDLGLFPKLKNLNVAATKTIVKGNVRKLNALLVHDESMLQKNQCVLECGLDSCFISTMGRNSTSEDIPMIRMRFTESTSIFGIIHAHENLATSIAAAAEMSNLADKYKVNFDGDIVDTLASEVYKIADTTQSYKESAITIAVLRDMTLVVSQIGFIRVAVIQNDGTVKYTTANTAPKSEERAPFVNRDDLGLLKTLGKTVVYRQNDLQRTETFMINKDSKYIVIASENVFDDFPAEVLGEMGKNATSAKDLAYDLHNTNFSYQRKSNTTVFVAGLGGESTMVSRK